LSHQRGFILVILLATSQHDRYMHIEKVTFKIIIKSKTDALL